MKRTILATALFGATLAGIALPATAQEVRLRAARVPADNVVATAKFYEDTFGMREMRKIEREGKVYEVILGFGATAEEVAASKSTKLVVIQRPANAGMTPVSPLVFGVADVKAAADKAVKAGGTISRPVSATGGVGFIKDPAGNEVELLKN